MVKKINNQMKYLFLFVLAYQISIDNFCNNSNNTSKINSNSLSDTTSKKPSKLDKMKVLENDENSQPIHLNTSKTTEKKKNALHR